MGQIWFERILRWRKKAQRFLQGRYARFDELNPNAVANKCRAGAHQYFYWLSLGSVIDFNHSSLRVLSLFSKHIHPRLNENQRFILRKQRLMQKVHAFRKRHLTQKRYRYFKCPKCQQSLRAPKGRGTIKVTCSNCRNQFIKKSDLLCFLV